MSFEVATVMGVVVPSDLLASVVSTKTEVLQGGPHVTILFTNGYGASIIHHEFSYGVELAVLDPDGSLTYDTPVTDDVIGHLYPDKLIATLRAISKLPDAQKGINE